MSQEEEKDLKELVTQCLAAKGFLSKIQAEIRAGVFVALEEEGVFKKNNLLLNKKLKDIVSSPDGLLAVLLVREFIEFFNLEFTALVFDPETHSGTDYVYEGRTKLAEKLKLPADEGSSLPLLCHLIRGIKNEEGNKSAGNLIDISLRSENDETILSPIKSNIENSNHLKNGDADASKTLLDETLLPLENDALVTIKNPSNVNSSPMGKLPPLGLKNTSNSPARIDMSQLNSLLNFEPDGGENFDNFEEELALSTASNNKKSDLEEIEEDLPPSLASGHSNMKDDLSCETTVSRVSGQADYTEDLSSS